MAKHLQKLELTWIGKGNEPKLEPRILIEDPSKSFGDPNSENMLINGDNLLALKALEQNYTNRIKCIYIDPPYNTGAAFEHYDDGVEHSQWLSLMKPRLELLRSLLTDDGSIYVSIDNNEMAYLQVLMDEIFQRKNRKNTIIIKRGSVTGAKVINPGLVNISEFILVYTKNASKWSPNRLSRKKVRDERYGTYIENYADNFSQWRFIPLLQAFALEPTCSDFEREFPSICFSIATGVGKTRLMGACIAYLYLEKGVRNFFVLAPNLTIYNKIIEDFGNSSNPKYVFNGLADFVHNKPIIITGDNYNQVSSLFSETEIHINIFNVAKFSRETKPTKEGGRNLAPRIKRLSEYLGQSYWEYLTNLKDLVILMDEAHRYHADASRNAINELKPILGIELTATPIDEKNNQFRNVVYEYSLAKALDDGLYVKNPTIATRKDFNPQGRSEEEIEKIKLEDAVSIAIRFKFRKEISKTLYFGSV